MRIKFCFAIVFICIMLAVGTATANIITVDDDEGKDHASIQAAVNNATAGDTILVYPGTYTENVEVNKSLTIISQSGNPDDTIVQAADSEDHVFHITADNVVINGFNVTGATRTLSGGIYLIRVEGCIVTNNILSHNENGILLWLSSSNTLSGNTANSNNHNGIFLVDSSNNTLNNNNAWNNDYKGIFLSYSSNNTLNSNTANLNFHGIALVGSSNNTLANNTANSNNFDGILLSLSSDNTLINNTVNSNDDYGIYLQSSNNNCIYNNYFENGNNVGFFGTNTGNTWNTTKTAGTNIVGGSYLGGNYWANPNGTGFSQTRGDADGDGICDSPYIIDENNIDYLPLSVNNAEFNPLIYDSNSNGMIDKGEVIGAIKDYFGDKISKDDVIEVIKEYFFGGEEPVPEEDEYIYGRATVQEIEILILESFPVQVNVVAKGYLTDGCTQIDQIITNREGNTFNVQITTIRPADATCTRTTVPFEEVIPLDVYGLEAGVYEVDVNGIKGSFELSVDNIISE